MSYHLSMEKWCLGAKCSGTRSIADWEFAFVEREGRRIGRAFWLSWAGLFVCIPYVVVSVVGALHGSAFFLNVGFVLSFVLLYPIVISAVAYPTYRRAYRAINADLASREVECYVGDLGVFFRTANAGLLFHEDPADGVAGVASATTVGERSILKGFPQRIPLGALSHTNASQRALVESEENEIRLQRNLLRRAWIAPTIILGVFSAAIVAAISIDSNAIDRLASLVYLTAPGYCGYRWFVTARLARSLDKDLRAGVVLGSIQDFEGEHMPIEVLPNSGLIWTIGGAPSPYRHN